MPKTLNLAAALAVCGAGAAAAETGGTFRDWTVTCSVGLACEASTLSAGGADLRSLTVSRRVDADARPNLSLGFGGSERITGPVRFTPDGGEPVELPAASFANGDGGAAASGAEVGERLLPALRDAARVVVRAGTDAGPREASFSLAGLVAALRRIDDAQARVGTPGALIDRGDRPLPDRATLPADVAAPQDLPEILRRVWTEGGGGCADRGEDPFGDLGFSIPAGEGLRLYALACGMPGAYNAPSRLYLAGEDVVNEMPLPSMGDGGPAAAMEAWNLDWSDGRFTAFFKGRGIGDCGTYSVWRFDPSGDAALRLVEERAKGECDGEAGDGPESWPLVWPRR